MTENLDIELINAFGPYTHGIWSKGKVYIGGDSSLGFRSDLLLNVISEYLSSLFSKDNISKLSLLDVGCYDGWLTHEISKMGFNKVVGIEPRQKNIKKGEIVRSCLGIDTNVQFIKGQINDLGSIFGGQKFDIVICCGLMHHMSSTIDSIAALSNVCKDVLIVNTICLPDEVAPQDLGERLELKDIPYFYKDKSFGFSGFKFESGYYDGSAACDSIVGIPSENLIKMCFDINFYGDIATLGGQDQFEKSLGTTYRKFNEVMIAGRRNEKKDFNNLGHLYETELANCLIDKKLGFDLFQLIKNGKPGEGLDQLIIQSVNSYLNNEKIKLGEVYSIFKNSKDGKIVSEILKNIYFCPHDKACVEIAKLLISENKVDEAISVALQVTQKLNSDWRSVYRLFYVLSKAYSIKNNFAEANRYKDLLFKSNPNFPTSLVD